MLCDTFFFRCVEIKNAGFHVAFRLKTFHVIHEIWEGVASLVDWVKISHSLITNLITVTRPLTISSSAYINFRCHHELNLGISSSINQISNPLFQQIRLLLFKNIWYKTYLGEHYQLLCDKIDGTWYGPLFIKYSYCPHDGDWWSSSSDQTSNQNRINYTIWAVVNINWDKP